MFVQPYPARGQLHIYLDEEPNQTVQMRINDVDMLAQGATIPLRFPKVTQSETRQNADIHG